MMTAKLLSNLGQSLIQVNHKTQFNVEYSRNLDFVCGDAILWKHGRNCKYVVVMSRARVKS